ncbi:hypothetical protein [Saccharothrix xinjiangensis]|uniref:Uncharacterized protein n=1 Tax=Saccharothrix xinjiangensis TaxID=204798 RepID=A0ABV9Y2N3_9PSEU
MHRPATVWFGPLAALWRELGGVVDQGTHPRQTRDLYLLGGMTAVVLSHGCHVVGRSDQGMVLARTAETLAVAIGHPELQAWALGTRALITESLERRSPVDAAPLDLVEQAPALVGRSRGTGVVRLLIYRARFAARAGAVGPAREAQAEARRARDLVGTGQGDLDAVGGILGFGPAKQQALDADIYYACGDHAAAERAAARTRTDHLARHRHRTPALDQPDRSPALLPRPPLLPRRLTRPHRKPGRHPVPLSLVSRRARGLSCGPPVPRARSVPAGPAVWGGFSSSAPCRC